MNTYNETHCIHMNSICAYNSSIKFVYRIQEVLVHTMIKSATHEYQCNLMFHRIFSGLFKAQLIGKINKMIAIIML